MLLILNKKITSKKNRKKEKMLKPKEKDACETLTKAPHHVTFLRHLPRVKREKNEWNKERESNPRLPTNHHKM